MQELYCHNCNGYVQFPIDLEMDGEYTLHCPGCRHEHMRYVEKGIISDRRWGSANRPALYAYTIRNANTSYTTTSTAYTTSSTYTWQLFATTAIT